MDHRAAAAARDAVRENLRILAVNTPTPPDIHQDDEFRLEAAFSVINALFPNPKKRSYAVENT